jgi:isoleucyl-tRNA synthetase
MWKPAILRLISHQDTGYQGFQWDAVFLLRNHVLSQLEISRKEKLIGKALEAKVVIAVSSSQLAESTLRAQEGLHIDFRELINVSQVEFVTGSGLPVCTVSKADGQKCERCWHWETDIGQSAEHPTLCGRCVEAVKPFKG